MAAAGANPRGMTAAARASLAALGLMLVVPFLQPVHRHPLTSFYSEWLALALGLAALIPLASNQWRELTVPVTALFLAAFGALLAMQQALGLTPYAGPFLMAVLYLAWAALLMILATTLRREIGMDRIVTVFAWCLAAAGAAGAVIAMLQFLGLASALVPLVAPAGKVVYGNLGQPNHFAAYTSLALASLVYLHASGRLRLAMAAVPAVLLVFVLGLSGSRSAWVYLSILLALGWFHARRAGVGTRVPAVWAGALIAAFIMAQWLVTLAWFSTTSGPAEVVTSAERLFAGEPAREIRWQLVREAWWMFAQAPVIGIGWGQFAWYEFSHHALTEGPGIWGWPHNHAHNIVLHLLAETGFIGAALVVGAGICWLWTQRRADFDLQRWWLLAVLGVLGAHSMLELPMWYAYFLGIAALALGAGSERNLALAPGARPSFAIVALVAVGALALATTFNAYRGFERLFARDGTAPAGAERSAILSRAHGDVLLRPYVEIALTFGIEVDRDRLREKIALNGRVLRFAPIDVVAFRQAQLLALAGEREAALKLFAQAARVYPAETQAATDAVRALAARHPAEMVPLLELASETLANQRAARAIR